MEKIELTQRELLILKSFKQTLQVLSLYLGPGHDVILYSFGNDDSSPYNNYNGYSQGKRRYYPLTSAEEELLEKIRLSPANQNGIIYNNKTYAGNPTRSTALPIRGEGNRIIALLCIRFNVDVVPASSLLEHLNNTNLDYLICYSSEVASDDIDEIVSQALKDARDELRLRGSTSSNRHKEVISILEKNNIFAFKNSIETVAKQMGLAKATVSGYLNKGNDA